VGSGLVGADSFTGLRSLITPAAKRSSRNSRRGHPPLSSSMAHAGRWALLRRSDTPPDHDQRLEHIARTLLRRYGVICWRLLERESDVLPPWRELLRCYHRLEARARSVAGASLPGWLVNSSPCRRRCCCGRSGDVNRTQRCR
jgi:ATP-dependent Lhr-like helicase